MARVEGIFLRHFFLVLFKSISIMIDCIFNSICNMVMNTVKYGLHFFKVVKIDVISYS